jgi:hypothetical protein
LGLAAYFEHEFRNTAESADPHPRVIYTLVLACVAFVAAVVLFIPFTSSIINYAFDFFMVAAWFAAFGVLIDWYGDPTCYNNKWCRRWKTLEAFSFISGFLWLLSMILVCDVPSFSRCLGSGGADGRNRASLSCTESASVLSTSIPQFDPGYRFVAVLYRTMA